ncbi:MATE family efflux transporter [Pendulispora rubella]|uniref:MATE family efflux transporter n=1 Tax=Pendulispora rubella TaxID=2741070 RepID=A0ABZ2KVS4_9BACT
MDSSVGGRFTEGPVARTLLAFSWPMLASSILQSLNASVNTAWVGRLLGARALTASANANTLVFFLIGTTFGLSMAANVLVGQSLGAKDLVTAKRTVGTSLSFFGGLSVVFAALGIMFAPHVLAAMHTPPDALPYASAYLRVIFLALPGMVLYAFVMTALRGAGDAKTPFVFLIASVAMDITLNPIFIRGLGPVPALGIAGSALATMVAQWVSLLGMVGWLYRRKHFLRLARGEAHYLRIDREILRALILKGVPMGLSVVVMSSSMIAMISLVNRFGSHMTAAYGACFQVWNYIQMPAMSLGGAVSAMAAQNVGAQQWERVARIARVGVLVSMAMTGAMVLLVSAAHRAAFAFFLGDDAEAIAIANHIHVIVSWTFIMFGISLVLGSVMRATGAVMVPLATLFVSLWVVRIPFAYALVPSMQAEAIWWSYPIGSVVSLVLTVAYYRLGSWRAARMLVAQPARA